PYPENALEPVISATTLNFHHGKHHKTYVETLNKLIKGTDYESSSLESIVADTAGKPDKAQVFNNAAQTWNHTFFWNCLKRGGGGKPTGAIAQKLEADFGGYDNFKKERAVVIRAVGRGAFARGCCGDPTSAPEEALVACERFVNGP